MHQAGRQPEPGRRRFQGGQQLAGHGYAIRQAIKAFRRAVGRQQSWCQSSKAGRDTGKT
jgi:hypothetical protein